MALDMANLGPDTTGIGAYIHVFQDVNRRARHGPRIKVFPGNPGHGGATVVVVPTAVGQCARIAGKMTVRPATLRRALRFAEINWKPLLRYWRDATMTTADLLDLLEPAE